MATNCQVAQQLPVMPAIPRKEFSTSTPIYTQSFCWGSVSVLSGIHWQHRDYTHNSVSFSRSVLTLCGIDGNATVFPRLLVFERAVPFFQGEAARPLIGVKFRLHSKSRSARKKAVPPLGRNGPLPWSVTATSPHSRRVLQCRKLRELTARGKGCCSCQCSALRWRASSLHGRLLANFQKRAQFFKVANMTHHRRSIFEPIFLCVDAVISFLANLTGHSAAAMVPS